MFTRITRTIATIITPLTLLALIGFGSSVHAALVNFTISGTVTNAVIDNGFGLAKDDIVSASGTYDDSTLDILGSGFVSIATPDGSASFNIGGHTFTDLDALGNPRLLFEKYDFLGFEYSTPEAIGTLRFLQTQLSFKGIDLANLTVEGLWDKNTFAVSAVPVPAAVWLFGSGLLGLIGMARRRKF